MFAYSLKNSEHHTDRGILHISTKIGYIRDRVLGGDLVPPG